ncbi:uncharacterized protein LOC125578991 [Brassica napus]|uniref:uncharacterized protein LOC125578991 n=1 Tax=Brassica napus TaxID=3708 RepID=UPI0020785406|nr:uncharacterized protein LOC125578991 [Brassica napus]
MAAQPLLKAGLRRSIGTGNNTMVWSDNWLPDAKPRPATPCGPSFNPNLRVSDLIDPTSHAWNLTRLQSIIAKEDVPLIMSLRIPRTQRLDSYCWAPTKSGAYTVQSGYVLATELDSAHALPSVSEPSTTCLKAKVWTLKTSRKIKHFIWSALSDSVPVCSRLSDRHCSIDRYCPRCGADDESVNHLLFECPPSAQTWALAHIPHSPGLFPSSSTYSNLNHLLWPAKGLGVPSSILDNVPWILWFIWKARNDKIFNGADISPLDTVQIALSEADNWRLAQIIHKAHADEEFLPQTSAQPLGHRCSFDASWHQDDALFGGGMVLTDRDGEKTFGSFTSNRGLTPLHAELHALLWAMKSTLQLDHLDMTFETDCQQLVKIIEDEKEEDWPSLMVEFEEFYYLHSMFNSCSLCFIPRSCNVRADGLAKGARARGVIFSHVNSRLPCWMAQTNHSELS